MTAKIKTNVLRLIMVLVLGFGLVPVYAQKGPKQYIHQFKNLAVQCMHRHQIPASVILGVALVESAAGQSDICQSFKNHFGIVGSNQGSRHRLKYHSVYKAYASDAASFRHFCELVKSKTFYRRLKGNRSYQPWVRMLNQTSYAGAMGAWQEKVMSAIQRYRLYQLDQN